MRTPVVISIALASLLAIGAATPALAGQSNHLSDSDYLNAARCAGIAEGLGEDTTAYDKVLDREAGARESFIVEQAATQRSDGVRLAHRNDPQAKARVAVEHDGFCKAYVS